MPPFSSALDLATRLRLGRGLAVLLGAGVLLAGICLGMGRLEGQVRHLPRYDHPLALEWQNLPDWLQLPDNRHILHALARRVDLRPTDRLLEPHLARRLGASLTDPDIGWIDRVDRVMVRPNGVVSIRCRFRRPAAWVRRHGSYYLVDARSIRLPGRYRPEDCAGSVLLTITGIKASPPRVGRLWQGKDLRAGLKLAGLIATHPFRRQVDHIIVANFGGRIDRNRPYIELATDRPGSRIWWGRSPDQNHGTEINAEQKLALLDRLYRQWHRIDLNRAYVDVRTHPDSVVLPAGFRAAAGQ